MQFPASVDLTCQLVTELAREFMTPSGLRPVDRARFEQHLHACTWCLTYIQQLAETVHAARRLAQEPAQLDTTRVLALFRRVAPPAPEVFAEIPSAPAPKSEHSSASAPVRLTGRSQRALKFLARGAIGALSGFAWPRAEGAQPGAWVEVDAPLSPCERGIHACGLGDLAHWLHDELWIIELDGETAVSVDGVVAARGRLLHEVAEWRLGGARRFAQAAYDHAHALVHAEPAPSPDALRCLASAARHLPRGSVALAAYCAAMAIARNVGGIRFDQDAYDAERRHQSMLIVRELSLADRLTEPLPA